MVHLRGFVARSCTYTFPSRLPDPDRLAVPTRPDVVGAAPALPRASEVRLPPASPGCCDSPAEELLHLLSVSWRLVAHGGVGPDLRKSVRPRQRLLLRLKRST